MKIKLLRKLRKQYILLKRNNMYKVFDNKKCLGSVYNQTQWISLNDALKIRRKWILKSANKYKKAK